MTGLYGAVGRTALELVPDLEPHWVEAFARAGLERKTFRFEQGSEAMGRWFDVFATPVEPHGRDKAQFLASLSRVFPEGAEGIFVAELEALWRDDRFVRLEGLLCTSDGRPFDAMFTLVFEGERAERTLVSVVDVSALKRLEERQQTPIAELDHRVKNSLAMVQAIALQTFRDSHGPQAREIFMARLQALAKAQDLLTRTSWEAAPFDALIAETVAPYATGCAFAPQGPRVTIEPRQVPSFALVLHELCTNAVKSGAASVPEGRIDIVWELREEAGARLLRLLWTERGGPPATPPTRTGFGSRLIARLAPNARFDYAQEGLVCVLDVRLDGGMAADLPSPGA